MRRPHRLIQQPKRDPHKAKHERDEHARRGPRVGDPAPRERDDDRGGARHGDEVASVGGWRSSQDEEVSAVGDHDQVVENGRMEERSL